MQKKILSMILAIAMVVSMFAGIAVTASAADPVALSFAGGDAKNHDTLTFADEASGVSAVFAKNNHSTAPRHDATCVRFYGTTSVTNSLTVSAPAGYNVTAIAFTMNGSYGLSAVSADSGAIDGTNWTGSANAVVFSTTAQTRIEGIAVTIEASGGCTHANETSETTTAPTCTEDGVLTYTCPDCAASWTEAIAALGHDWTEEIVTPATCTEDGAILATCSRCSATEDRVITATGHDFTNGDCACGEPAPSADKFALVTDIADLTEGDVIIITSADATYALSTTQNSNNRAAVAITANEDGTITSDGTEIQHITIGAGTNVANTLTFGVEGGYLYAAGTSGNYLRTQETNDANGEWIITLAEGVFTVLAQGTNRPLMRYNSSSKLFACYAATSTTGTTVAIYEKVASNDGGTDTCEHTASDAGLTCNEDGTHSYVCALCGEAVTANCDAEVVETIDATCNSYASTAYECSVCGGEWTVEGTEYGAHAWDGASCTACGATRNIYTKVADPSALADGSGIVIYYPAKSLLLSGTANGNKLNGVAATVTESIVSADEGGELFLIVRKDANGDFYFETEDGKYLTTSATGNSLTLEESLTDYAKWYFDTTGTVATLRIVNRNASYTNANGTFEIAFEYYNGITAYSIKDTEIYNFEVYQREGFSAHTHIWDDGVVTTAATCTADGVKTYTCACGDTQTEVIPAIGHDFTAGETCGNCGAAVIKGQYTAALAAGDTIIIYNPASNMTLTNTASGYYLAGLAAVACGDYIITAAPEATIWTVEVVDAEAGTYRFKTADGIYLQTNSNSSFTNSADLAAEGETDYSVWTLVDGQYLKSAATNKAIEYYGNKWTTYGLSTTNTAFNLKLFKTNVESFCEHSYVETVVSTPDCVTDGVSTFTCSLCSDTYTTTVAATGHSYELVEEIDPTCTVDGSKAYECTVCGDAYEEAVPATGHSDADLNGACDTCGESFEYDIWELSTTAPAAGNKYIIVAKDAESGKYYALTTNDVNAATSEGVEVVVSNGKLYNPVDEVIYGAREHTYTSGDSSWTGIGFYISTAAKCLHLNSSKIRVTTSAQNGVFSFTAGTAENTFVMLGDVNARYLTFSGTSFGVSSTAGTDLYFFYQVCEHEETYVSGAKDATCTEAGSTGTTKCAWCAAEVIAAEEIPAFGHTEVLIDNGDGTHYGQCSICLVTLSEATEHTFVDGVCGCGAVGAVEPTLDSNISIGETLSLDSDLTMNLRIKTSQLTAYDLSTAYLVVERDIYTSSGTMEVETRTLTDYTIKDNRLVFAYTGISAAQMNDEIRAVLYIKDANGKEYKSNQKVTSVAIYSNLMLGASAGNTKLITLIMDLLNYGTAAQIYFNRHADAPVNQAFESFITYADYASTDLSAVLEDLSGTISNGNASATISQGLDLSTKIGITYKVKLPAGVDAATATLVVKDANGNALETFDLSTGTVDSKGRYCVTFFGSTSRDMRRVVHATVMVDGAAISDTYTYSISTYAHTIATTAGMPASLVELTKLMVIYGDSAEAYFAG